VGPRRDRRARTPRGGALRDEPLHDHGERRVALTLTGERLVQPAALYRSLGIAPFVDALELPGTP
jgi:hypothetical protein